ncbi:MAG TPA: hypothetical protein VHH57_10420 [Gaiella sp.]|nr:hypothetical protein [Gaiella sp.]
MSDEREKIQIEETENVVEKVGEGKVDEDDFEAHKLVVDRVADPGTVDVDKYDEGD